VKAVLERDYVAESVRPRAFAARFAPGAFAAAILLFLAITRGEVGGEDWDRVGADAFRVISWLLLVFLTVTVPFQFVGSLLLERQRNTLEILLTTPEGARGAAAGKFLARLGTCLGWIAAAIPPLTVAVLFGGTSWRTLFNTGLGLLGWTLELAAWGLLVSAVARKLATAAVLAYLLPAAHWSLANHVVDTGFGAPWSLLLPAASPVSCMDMPAWDQHVAACAPGALGAWLHHPGLWYLLVGAILSALAIPAAAWALGREDTGPRQLGFRIPRSRADAWLRLAITRGNPIAWKESLLLNTAWSRTLYYLVMILLLIAETIVLVLFGDGQWTGKQDIAYLSTVCTILLALAALQGAASMAFEKTQGTFDLLRVTPLTPGEIARGKFVGTLLGLGFLFVVPVAHFLVTTIMGLHRPWTAAVGCATAALMAANAAVHGLTWGTLARSPATALAGAASFAVFAIGGCWLLCFMPLLLAGMRLLQREDTSDFFEVLVVPAAFCGSPILVFAMLSALDDVGSSGRSGTAQDILSSAFLGGLSLAVCGIYLAYRLHRLPEMLEREMARLGEGGDRFFAPGRYVLRPTEDRLADFVRRQKQRGGRGGP
jgi:ABC-type transport system involved in multi-copper enzyme maturation permease subunit